MCKLFFVLPNWPCDFLELFYNLNPLMSFVQTEVDHLPLIVRNYPTKYLYTITFNSMVASEDENNKTKKTLFKEKNLLIKKMEQKWKH